MGRSLAENPSRIALFLYRARVMNVVNVMLTGVMNIINNVGNTKVIIKCYPRLFLANFLQTLLHDACNQSVETDKCFLHL